MNLQAVINGAPIRISISAAQGPSGIQGDKGDKGDPGTDAEVTNANVAAVIAAAGALAPITGAEEVGSVVGGVLKKSTWTQIKAWVLEGISLTWDAISGKPTAFPPEAHTHVSADIADASDYAIANKLVKYGTDGRIYVGNLTTTSGAAITGRNSLQPGVEGISGNNNVGGVYGWHTGSGPGGVFVGGSGQGARMTSTSGSGSLSSTASGTYHSEFGSSGDNRSFVARVLGSFGWWRGAFNGRIQAAATLTANRTWNLPDADGTITLQPIPISTATTAAIGQTYHTTATLTVTDPSPVEGRGYDVLVLAGTATVGGTAYANAGTLIRRRYQGGAWSNRVYRDETAYALRSNNLSDLASASTALINLGGGAAGRNVFAAATATAVRAIIGKRKFVKSNTDTRTNTSIATADSELAGISVVAGTVYKLTVYLNTYYTTASPTGGVQFRIGGTPAAFPSLQGFGMMTYWATGTISSVAASAGTISIIGVSNTPTDSSSQVYAQICFKALATGNIELRFAQNNAVAGATLSLQPGSFIEIEET